MTAVQALHANDIIQLPGGERWRVTAISGIANPPRIKVEGIRQGDGAPQVRFFPLGKSVEVVEQPPNLSEDRINQTSISHARAAARALMELSESAERLARNILEDPKAAWAMAGNTESLAHLVQVAAARLAKAEALQALTDRD